MVGTTFLMFSLFALTIACFKSKVAEPMLLVSVTVLFVPFFFLTAMIPLTGGFMNPTFTISRATIYMAAQFTGTIIGFVLLKSVMSHDRVEKYHLAGCTVNAKGGTSGISLGTAFILEFSCTFLVCLIGVTVAFDQKRSKELGSTMVSAILGGSTALAIVLSMTVTGKEGCAGAGVNPARCLGLAMLQGDVLWDGHWVFWLGPLFACFLYYIFSINLPREGFS